jgi:hypothetical protein
MPYKILILDKSLEEYWVHDNKREEKYNDRKNLAEMESRFLERQGHNVTLCFGLDNLTEELFSEQDCVLVHPDFRNPKTQSILEFHHKYPGIGLIITPSGYRRDDGQRTLQKHFDDVYILEKPYKIEEFFSAIEKVVQEARKK